MSLSWFLKNLGFRISDFWLYFSSLHAFRVGFNSVYHLTDLPSFVSGKYVVLFDPQGVYLPRVSAANPGKRIDFTSSSALSLYNDQFYPYCAFGCDMESPFAGTLFRFPLRNVDQAAGSKLSRQAYKPDDISLMFDQLFEEGVFALLFLKTVLCIDMYVWDVGEHEPKKLYSCSINPATDDTVWHRQALLRLSKCINTTNSEVDSFSLDFLSEAVCGTETKRRTQKFYVVQTMASTSSRIGSFATKASKEYDIHLLPWASVAACTSDNSLSLNVIAISFAVLSILTQNYIRFKLLFYFFVYFYFASYSLILLLTYVSLITILLFLRMVPHFAALFICPTQTIGVITAFDFCPFQIIT